MPDRPPPTPISVSSFRSVQDGGLQISELLDYLRVLVREALNDDESDVQSSEVWMSVISELCENVLANFPKYDPGVWSTIHDKIQLCSTSLEVIQRAAPKVDRLFGPEHERAETVLESIIALLSTLWSWPVNTASQVPGVDGVWDLRRKASQAFGALIVPYDKSQEFPLSRALLRVCDGMSIV